MFCSSCCTEVLLSSNSWWTNSLECTSVQVGSHSFCTEGELLLSVEGHDNSVKSWTETKLEQPIKLARINHDSRSGEFRSGTVIGFTTIGCNQGALILPHSSGIPCCLMGVEAGDA